MGGQPLLPPGAPAPFVQRHHPPGADDSGLEESVSWTGPSQTTGAVRAGTPWGMQRAGMSPVLSIYW